MNSKTLIFFIICFYLTNSANSQHSPIKDRYNFKLSYASYPQEYAYGHRIPNLRIGADYGLLRHLELGIYTGYSSFSCYNLAGGGDNGRKANTLFYGVNINFNPLCFIIKAEEFRFDLYLTAKYGGHHKFIPENYSLPRNMVEYSLGIGTAFYILKHIGLFAEYNYGNFDYFDVITSSNQKTTPPAMLRLGLTYKYRHK